MSILLDTHVLLWFLEADRRLSADVTRTIERTEDAHVSAASIWELSIKAATGKLPRRSFVALAQEKGFALLSVTAAHGEAVVDLPQIHKDPFDHLLLAQAKVEGLTLVTHDRVLADYGVPVLLV